MKYLSGAKPVVVERVNLNLLKDVTKFRKLLPSLCRVKVHELRISDEGKQVDVSNVQYVDKGTKNETT